MKLQSRTLRLSLLAFMLVGAAFLRLYALDRGDAISDEVLYGFRSIGMLDFDFANAQPTVLQLFEDKGLPIPLWTALSFHDHPALVFLVQHWSMLTLGPNLWGLRLPSALFGVASVILIFLVARKLFSGRTGTIAASVAATNVLLVYASRTGVQESQVIFFILLSVYCFLRAVDRPADITLPQARWRNASRSLGEGWWYAWGASFGLALLSKYTAGFLVLPFALYGISHARSIFRSTKLYAGIAVVCIIFSPALIYNLKLYQSFGHFDFQLSYMFGQRVEYWSVTPGKEIGTLSDRIIGIPRNLNEYNEPTFNALAAVAVGALIIAFFKRKEEKHTAASFVLFGIISQMLVYLAIGPSPRFLTTLIPWLCIAIGYLVDWILRTRSRYFKELFIAAFILSLARQTFFSVNSYVLAQPLGTEGIAYSRIHWDMHPWGFNELDRFIAQATAGTYPQLTIPYRYEFLETIKTKSIAEAKEAGKKPQAVLFVYDGSMSDLGALWTINRRSVYEGWPMVEAGNYLTALQEKGEGFYYDNGFTDIYFIRSTEYVLKNQSGSGSAAATQLEKKFIEHGVKPVPIRNQAGEEAFAIYHTKAPITNGAKL